MYMYIYGNPLISSAIMHIYSVHVLSENILIGTFLYT